MPGVEGEALRCADRKIGASVARGVKPHQSYAGGALQTRRYQKSARDQFQSHIPEVLQTAAAIAGELPAARGTGFAWICTAVGQQLSRGRQRGGPHMQAIHTTPRSRPARARRQSRRRRGPRCGCRRPTARRRPAPRQTASPPQLAPRPAPAPANTIDFASASAFVCLSGWSHPEVAFINSESFMNQSKAASSLLLSTVRAGRSRQKSQARKQNAHGGSRHTWSSAAAPLASMGAGTSGRSARGIVAWSASATYSTCGHRRVGLCLEEGLKMYLDHHDGHVEGGRISGLLRRRAF